VSIGKRYIFTGTALVVPLVALVIVVRLMHGAPSQEHFENLKIKGPHHAPIHMIVYSDFQCPACQSSLVPIEELRSQFSDVLQVEFRHFPLERAHRWTVIAASFAECAAEQGKFWEFHDRMFLEQLMWSKSEDALPVFANYAQELNLNRQALEQCLENPKTLAKIRSERSMGEKQNVQSTPTIFINGHPLVGGLQLKMQGREVVLEELKKLGVKPAAKN